MKILVFSDLHGNLAALDVLLAKCADNCELILCLGDLTNEGSPRMIKSILGMLKSTGKPCLVVPGNMDNQSVIELIEAEKMLLDKNSFEFQGITFVGVGGAVDRGVLYRNTVSESSIKENLEKLSQGKSDLVYVMHVPPYQTEVDKNFSGNHIGSEELTKAIIDHKPLVCLSGHTHVPQVKEKVGETFCANPGSLEDGFAGILTINDEIEIEWIELNK